MSNSKKYYKHTIINKLNNYNWNDEEIENVKNYISKRVYPFFKTNAQKDRFIDKYNDFIIENNKLIFKPLMLELIPNNKRDETLTNFMIILKLLVLVKLIFIKKYVQII